MFSKVAHVQAKGKKSPCKAFVKCFTIILQAFTKQIISFLH